MHSVKKMKGKPFFFHQHGRYIMRIEQLIIVQMVFKKARLTGAISLLTLLKTPTIFNTYGPNMDPKDGRVVSNFINQCINNENITIYGDGSQTRSFCYIDDMVVAVGIINTIKYFKNY